MTKTHISFHGPPDTLYQSAQQSSAERIRTCVLAEEFATHVRRTTDEIKRNSAASGRTRVECIDAELCDACYQNSCGSRRLISPFLYG